MLVWCALLFGLGVLAFVDSVFNMGEIFRRANSFVFLLISLGLLIRTTTKKRASRNEKMASKVYDLEQKVRSFRRGQENLKKMDESILNR